jgi:hypothetical protein
MSDQKHKHIKVYLPREVRGDCPIGHLTIAGTGVHDAISNKYDAVSVILPDGKLLGVKPGEFERIM